MLHCAKGHLVSVTMQDACIEKIQLLALSAHRNNFFVPQNNSLNRRDSKYSFEHPKRLCDVSCAIRFRLNHNFAPNLGLSFNVIATAENVQSKIQEYRYIFDAS